MRRGASLSYVSLDSIETQQSQSMTLNLRSGKGGMLFLLASDQRDGDGRHGGREPVQVGVRLHGREHEVRPEPSLLLVAAGVREHGAHGAERRMTPQQRSAAPLLSCTSGTE